MTPGPDTLRVMDFPFVVLVRVQASEPVIFRITEPSGASLNVPYCRLTGMSTCTTKPQTFAAMSKGDEAGRHDADRCSPARDRTTADRPNIGRGSGPRPCGAHADVAWPRAMRTFGLLSDDCSMTPRPLEPLFTPSSRASDGPERAASRYRCPGARVKVRSTRGGCQGRRSSQPEGVVRRGRIGLRTTGLVGLRRATSSNPARSYIDFAPKNMESGWLRSSLSTG